MARIYSRPIPMCVQQAALLPPSMRERIKSTERDMFLQFALAKWQMAMKLYSFCEEDVHAFK